MSTVAAHQRAMREVEPHEQLLWWGTPGGLASIAAAKAGTLLFMTVWVLFAIAWTGLSIWSVYFAEPPETELIFLAFPWIGLAFILIGMGGLTWHARGLFLAFNTVYGITDFRIVIIEGSKAYTFRAPELSYIRRTGGERRGTLSFAIGAIERGAKPGGVLLNIEEPASVEALIRQSLLKPA